MARISRILQHNYELVWYLLSDFFACDLEVLNARRLLLADFILNTMILLIITLRFKVRVPPVSFVSFSMSVKRKHCYG